MTNCENQHENIISICIDILARAELNEYMSLHNDALTILITLSYLPHNKDSLFQAIPSYISLIASYFHFNNPAKRVLIDKLLILLGNLCTSVRIISYRD